MDFHDEYHHGSLKSAVIQRQPLAFKKLLGNTQFVQIDLILLHSSFSFFQVNFSFNIVI